MRDFVCPACGSPASPLRLRVAELHQLRECRSCGTQFLRSVITSRGSSEYWEPYKFGIYASDAVREDFESRYRRTLGAIPQACGPIRTVLDVGCGTGNFLDFARREGLEAIGADVDPRAVAAARARGLSAHLDSQLDAVLPNRGADAVLLWDVIEHVEDPAALVGRYALELRAGGVMVVETPDAAFPFRRLARAIDALSLGHVKTAELIYYLEHKTYFTEHGLRTLLIRKDLDPFVTLRENSAFAKTQQLLDWSARTGSLTSRLLAPLWPWLDRAARRLGSTNKMIVLAAKR